MSLKKFTTILFFFSFVYTSVSHANEPVLRKIENEEVAVKSHPDRCMKKDSSKKVTSLKDKHLNGDLAILEKSMERKVDNKAFGDICKRYIDLTRQYGEADRAISFFNGLAERHPQSPNALTVSGAKTYGQREIEAEAGFNQRLNLIKSRLNLICSQHGHDRIPTEYKEPVINHRL